MKDTAIDNLIIERSELKHQVKELKKQVDDLTKSRNRLRTAVVQMDKSYSNELGLDASDFAELCEDWMLQIVDLEGYR